MKTRITELLGIEAPLILPGMSWISTPQLVAAVSNAGGLGILASGPLTPEETRAAIREIRELTDKPFGVGVTLLMPGAKENAMIALEEKVPVINFSLGKGDWLVKKAHEYGGKVIATVVSEKHALSAQSIGADALLVTGHEAAAHGGDVTSLVLVPSIASKVDIPVIATGGFADARGLMAALSLGAEAVAMGSRFATSADSPLHNHVKETVIKKSEQETIYSKNFDGLWARVMKTPRSVKETKRPMNLIMAGIEATKAAKIVKQPVWKIMLGMMVMLDKIKLLAYFGASVPRLQAATINGDLDKGVQFIGQTQGLIEDIPTVQELVDRILADAKAMHESNNRFFS
ncbi:NAD(P)H-dependent flavin oxidoreductase [Thalassolituus sp. UBA3500]|uniref:NAD(P)H-dependent flavin oxidoreductase n=1 Tax=Thalassolituus sp. UBA3500 TaxID=1947664 RepID=UPI0023B4DBC3|nr:nitronate monooxygenase [Thalassolituus sp. UBA3500]|tara:strand:+ start:3477 stop:4511 length:1035 start_codon:yes stop_codon:yes gene_type:complete